MLASKQFPDLTVIPNRRIACSMNDQDSPTIVGPDASPFKLVPLADKLLEESQVPQQHSYPLLSETRIAFAPGEDFPRIIGGYKPGHRGRPSPAVDLAYVYQLAAKGAPIQTIARRIGMDPVTLYGKMTADNPNGCSTWDVTEIYAFTQTVKMGHGRAGERVLTAMMDSALDPKSKSGGFERIFLAKQPHTLGFVDHRMVQHQGEISFKVTVSDAATKQAQTIDITPSKDKA